MTDPFHWTCPHCNRAATVTDSNIAEGSVINHVPSGDVFHQLSVRFVSCPNPDCGKYSLSCSLQQGDQIFQRELPPWVRKQELPPLPPFPARLMDSIKTVKEWNLIPTSAAKVFPDYVPQQIREDYEESCIIADSSPKAAATLARRCLQGMIRDFWGTEGKRNLYAEIEAIKEKVDSLTWEAIDGVRKIGNIGAHMEMESGLIVEVDASEASQLITLIEILIKDWYINHAERQANFAGVKKIADKKERQRKSARAKKKKNADPS